MNKTAVCTSALVMSTRNGAKHQNNSVDVGTLTAAPANNDNEVFGVRGCYLGSHTNVSTECPLWVKKRHRALICHDTSILRDFLNYDNQPFVASFAVLIVAFAVLPNQRPISP